MAKKNHAEEVLAQANGETVVDPFAEFGGETVAKELDGTFDKAPGNIISGRISHAYDYVSTDQKGGKSTVNGLAIVVDRETPAMQDGNSIMAEPGSLIGLTLSTKLFGLALYEPGSAVLVRVDKKVKLRTGYTWQYTASAKGKKRPGGNPIKPSMRQAPVEVADVADEEISDCPF